MLLPCFSFFPQHSIYDRPKYNFAGLNRIILTPSEVSRPSLPPEGRSFRFSRLTDDQQAVLGEIVGWNLEVERGRSLSYATRDVVVGTVARAEPATEVTGLADGDTTKMGADTCKPRSWISNLTRLGVYRRRREI